MKYLSSIFCILMFLLLMGCNSSTSWAFQFVKYNNVHYIVTEDEVEHDNLGGKLGEVKYFLENEENSKEFSSNKYPVGTEIYEIKDVDVSKEIAIIDEKGKIIRLVAEE